jgi:hypothetical protein
MPGLSGLSGEKRESQREESNLRPTDYFIARPLHPSFEKIRKSCAEVSQEVGSGDFPISQAFLDKGGAVANCL